MLVKQTHFLGKWNTVDAYILQVGAKLAFDVDPIASQFPDVFAQ